MKLLQVNHKSVCNHIVNDIVFHLQQHIHFQQQIPPKKSKSKTSQKKSSPTTHVTETSFLHILDPPDHFGTIYIFDHFFTYIHNLDMFFFNKFSLKKSRVSSVFTFESAAECGYASNFTDVCFSAFSSFS